MTDESQRNNVAEEILIEIKKCDLINKVTSESITSIVHDAGGASFGDRLGGLCIDVGQGRVTIRWGKEFGEHSVPWKIPYEDIQFSALGDLRFKFVAIAGEIRVRIGKNDLVDGAKSESITSIVHDASGHLLDEILDGLCIDVGQGEATIRWGKGFGEHFVKWRMPFEDVQFPVRDFRFWFMVG